MPLSKVFEQKTITDDELAVLKARVDEIYDTAPSRELALMALLITSLERERELTESLRRKVPL